MKNKLTKLNKNDIIYIQKIKNEMIYGFSPKKQER